MTGTGAGGGYIGPGPNHCGVPGAGRPPEVWIGAVGGPHGVAVAPPATAGTAPPTELFHGVAEVVIGLVGGLEWTAPQAESPLVIAPEAMSYGRVGSRGSSGGTGTSSASGRTGACGVPKTGRTIGASAACWTYGSATLSGAAEGTENPSGRSIGAYSGPSSQLAIHSS